MNWTLKYKLLSPIIIIIWIIIIPLFVLFFSFDYMVLTRLVKYIKKLQFKDPYFNIDITNYTDNEKKWIYVTKLLNKLDNRKSKNKQKTQNKKQHKKI